MTLQNYLVIVIGENGNEYSSIKSRVTTEFQGCEVAFAHAPIGSNTLVTMNDLYDVLTNSMCDFVIVVMASALDITDIESAVVKFDGEYNTSQKPLIRKGFGSTNFEWYGRYDLASAIVVAKRIEFFEVLKKQMSQGQITRNPAEGESK